MTFTSSIQVPTFNDDVNQEKQVRLSDMTPKDLDDLKTRDPFMYHSIPAVREASLLHKDVDGSILTSHGASNVVKRQKRITFECHSDKLFIDDMLSSNAQDHNNDGEGTEDGLYSYLAHLERQSNDHTGTSFEVQTVPASAPRPMQISTENMSSQDLIELRECDPFLFYSIPAVRNAALRNTLSIVDLEIDLSAQLPQTVTRKSRITFECHADAFLPEIAERANSDRENNNVVEEENEEEGNWYLSMLLAMQQQD
jgi:hypothetical protein